MKEKIYIGLVMALISLIVPLPLWGYTETFYLRKNGPGTAPETVSGAWDLSDVNNSGNWSSVNADDGKLGPNDRLVVLDDDGVVTGQLWIRESGQPGKPITVEGEKNGNATFDGNGTITQGVITLDSKDHIVLQDLTVTNSHPGVYSNGVSLRYDCDNNILRRLAIHGHGESGVQISFGSKEKGYPDDNVVEYCHVYNNGLKFTMGPSGISMYFCGSNNVARYNLIHHNVAPYSQWDGNGIIFDFAQGTDNKAYYNVIYCNDGGGVNIVHPAGGTFYIYGNTIYGNAGKNPHDHAGIMQVRGDGVFIIENNVMYNNNGLDLRIDDTTGHRIDYNHYGTGNVIRWGSWGNVWSLSTFRMKTGHETHGGSGDPKFADVSAGDFTLRPDSPCIDRGGVLDAAYRDGLEPGSSWPYSVSTILQDGYGAGWEIGAFIYKDGDAANPPPDSPINVRIVRRDQENLSHN